MDLLVGCQADAEQEDMEGAEPDDEPEGNKGKDDEDQRQRVLPHEPVEGFLAADIVLVSDVVREGHQVVDAHHHDKDHLHRQRAHKHQEGAIVALADARAEPGTVVVEAVNEMGWLSN
jgi:hypothetical protein